MSISEQFARERRYDELFRRDTPERCLNVRRSDYRCAECKNKLVPPYGDSVRMKFCPMCGQRIDWSSYYERNTARKV